MKLTFLGTSAAKPTRERNVSALALELDQDKQWYLFDCGEATQHQILRSRLSIGKLDSIFITHLHGDHYYGLPGLLASKKLDTALNPLTIYAPKGLKTFLQCAMDLSPQHLGYALQIIEYAADETLVFDRFTAKVLPLVHSIDCVAFYIKENDISNKLDEKKLRSIGLQPSPLYGELKKGRKLRFQGRVLDAQDFMLEPVIGRTLIIAGDNSTPTVLGGYLDNLDLLVHECTYTQDVYNHMTKKYLHTTAKDLGLAVQDKQVKNLIANHISPRYNSNSTLKVELIYNEIKQNYNGRLFIANDFDVYYLGRNSVLEKS